MPEVPLESYVPPQNTGTRIYKQDLWGWEEGCSANLDSPGLQVSEIPQQYACEYLQLHLAIVA